MRFHIFKLVRGHAPKCALQLRSSICVNGALMSSGRDIFPVNIIPTALKVEAGHCMVKYLVDRGINEEASNGSYRSLKMVMRSNAALSLNQCTMSVGVKMAKVAKKRKAKKPKVVHLKLLVMTWVVGVFHWR